MTTVVGIIFLIDPSSIRRRIFSILIFLIDALLYGIFLLHLRVFILLMFCLIFYAITFIFNNLIFFHNFILIFFLNFLTKISLIANLISHFPLQIDQYL